MTMIPRAQSCKKNRVTHDFFEMSHRGREISFVLLILGTFVNVFYEETHICVISHLKWN